MQSDLFSLYLSLAHSLTSCLWSLIVLIKQFQASPSIYDFFLLPTTLDHELLFSFSILYFVLDFFLILGRMVGVHTICFCVHVCLMVCDSASMPLTCHSHQHTHAHSHTYSHTPTHLHIPPYTHIYTRTHSATVAFTPKSSVSSSTTSSALPACCCRSSPSTTPTSYWPAMC